MPLKLGFPHQGAKFGHANFGADNLLVGAGQPGMRFQMTLAFRAQTDADPRAKSLVSQNFLRRDRLNQAGGTNDRARGEENAAAQTQGQLRGNGRASVLKTIADIAEAAKGQPRARFPQVVKGKQ